MKNKWDSSWKLKNIKWLPIKLNQFIEDFFFGSDGIGFGIIKRWDGSKWVECKNIKVRWY